MNWVRDSTLLAGCLFGKSATRVLFFFRMYVTYVVGYHDLSASIACVREASLPVQYTEGKNVSTIYVKKEELGGV